MNRWYISYHGLEWGIGFMDLPPKASPVSRLAVLGSLERPVLYISLRPGAVEP